MTRTYVDVKAMSDYAAKIIEQNTSEESVMLSKFIIKLAITIEEMQKSIANCKKSRDYYAEKVKELRK